MTGIVEGNNTRLVLAGLEEEYGEEAIRPNLSAARSVLTMMPDPSTEPANVTGLLLGRIQAGKTNAVITTIAMAADSGYRVFIVLTSDNTWLTKQTTRRLALALPGLFMGEDYLSSAENAGRGVVVVCSKNRDNLARLYGLLAESTLGYLPALIIDDEADQATPNTNQRSSVSERSAINGLVTMVRDYFAVRAFLQVTATPQALLLQPQNGDLRPEFVVVVEPGSGYVGGSIFFGADSEHYIRYVDNDEVSRFLDCSDLVPMPAGLMRAVSCFLIGATMQRLAGAGRTFDFLCHVSQYREDHAKVAEAIRRFTDDVDYSLRNRTTPSGVIDALIAAHQDLSRDVPSPFTLDQVLDNLAVTIASVDIQVMNSDNDEVEPRSFRMFNFIIGGNRLGRGITLKNLLVTYYGRTSRTPQMDTVHQHARMYGYRRRDLVVTRIFTTMELAHTFRALEESDADLRSLIHTGMLTGFEPVTVPIGVRESRSNVLSQNVGYYVPGTFVFPAYPEYRRTMIEEHTRHLDALLENFNRDNVANAEAEATDIDFLIGILSHIRGTGARWDTDRIIAALTVIGGRQGNAAYLVVRRGRRLSRPSDGRLHDVADSGDRPFLNARSNCPVLLMTRQDGAGWDGCDLWLPLLRFPDGNYVLAFDFPSN